MTRDQHLYSALAAMRRVFLWWGAELLACVPARWRLYSSSRRSRRVLLLGSREAVVGQYGSDGTFTIERRWLPAGVPARGASEARAPVRLRLEAESALRLQIPLPAAALENLKEAVAFQLDRYTPFAPDQVYLACTAGERASGSDAVPVSVTVVERHVVADAIAQAKRNGFTVASVEVARDRGREPAELLPIPELRTRSLAQLASTAAAAVLLVALASAAVVLPFAREQSYADALHRQLAAARSKADAVMRLEKAIATQKAQADFLVSRKRDRVSALEILAELTRLSPDDTWLSSADFNGTEVQISGISGSASDLLGRIDTSQIFRKAEFRSPVTPDAATGREHFAIAAEIGRGSAQ
jgi:general secretion pathway protein L